MDTNRLKRFAQEARKSLLDFVKTRLSLVLAENSAARREKPQAVAKLQKACETLGNEVLIDKIAYTWFNRLCALRFMDVMGYNPIRIVSPLPGHFQPEILEEAKGGNIDETFVTSATLRERIRGLLGGQIPAADGQAEAYKLLLFSTCNAYHKVMPFLFQPIDDYTELLLPDDLMKENSILMKTRDAITEDTASSGVEVIGWLYQFYISEKKDEVMGKTVKTEDIPAATQLFTPDWIVRYLVQNSLGRLWMLNHPNSKLAEEMEYYIPVDSDQCSVVSDQCSVDSENQKSNHYSLNTNRLKISSPEEIRICDPCCGSGHMLTYAFDLLVKIYEEEGYDRRKIPSLILVKNLYGVEIDDRAGELAAFALTMKAREYDSRFLRRENSPRPQICVLENFSEEWSVVSGQFEDACKQVGCKLDDFLHDIHLFKQADCMGSLLTPKLTTEKLSALIEYFSNHYPLITNHSLFEDAESKNLQKVLCQADFLSQKYHVVVTNPPYMGGKGMNADLKRFAERLYPDSKSDLFAMFIERCLQLIQVHGTIGMITMQSWMFLSSFEKLRTKLLDENTILSMAHLGARGFDSIGGEVVQTTAFTMTNTLIPDYKGAFIRLVDGNNEAEKAAMFREAVR